MNVVIGISWPFANGNLHIGHAASSLPGDVVARYHRLRGNKVILVSGTDCHGTPTELKAFKLNTTPKDLVDNYHDLFQKDFKDFGISFDLYNRTDDKYHKKFVREQFVKYLKYGYLEEKREKHLYCNHCHMYLSDRYIVGVCPNCGSKTKGDECEKCGSLLTMEEVNEKKCVICGSTPIFKIVNNLYFKLSIFEPSIRKLLKQRKNDWRENAVKMTENYLKIGIHDRCVSRILNYGIGIPVREFEDKKIYGWFENVWGYVTTSKKYAEEHGLNWEDFWKNGRNNKIYLFHAKDNIPFHSVIFPSLLLGTHDNYKLPDKIVSDEYVTIEGEKISKNSGEYINLRHLLDNYEVDAIRYYLSINNPEKKDFNFNFEDFVNSVNSELIGKWGNFVNRVLQFINKSFNGKILNFIPDRLIEKDLITLYELVGEDIYNGNTKDGIIKIFDYIKKSNKYFDKNRPWNLIKDDINKCQYVLYNCLNIIFNINNLLKPYLIKTTLLVEKYLNNNNNKWQYKQINSVKLNESIKPLFIRYDKNLIVKEKGLFNTI